MKPRKAVLLLLILIPACLTFAASSVAGRPWAVLLAFVSLQLALFIFRSRDARWMEREDHAWQIGRHYRPRPTDAGRWVDAPIAEIDKSTVGKLLASRLQRVPGLRCLRYGTGEPPRGSFDSLYDPELDG